MVLTPPTDRELINQPAGPQVWVLPLRVRAVAVDLAGVSDGDLVGNVADGY